MTIKQYKGLAESIRDTRRIEIRKHKANANCITMRLEEIKTYIIENGQNDNYCKFVLKPYIEKSLKFYKLWLAEDAKVVWDMWRQPLLDALIAINKKIEILEKKEDKSVLVLF